MQFVSMKGKRTTDGIVFVLQLHYKRFAALWTVSRTTRVSWYQKGKTNLDILQQEIVVAVASAGPYAYLHLAPDRITMPASHHSVFTGRMPFLPPNQQHQSTECNTIFIIYAMTTLLFKNTCHN